MAEPALTHEWWTTLEMHVCGECGIMFAAPKTFFEDRRKDHGKNWHCPNGHSRVFANETDAQKFQRERDEARRDADWQRQLREKADKNIRKLERRIANGVCPCCHRHFENVERHMKHKHPDFSAPKAKKAG